MYRQVSYKLARLPLHNRREGQSEEPMKICIDIRSFLLNQISPYRRIPNQNFELIKKLISYVTVVRTNQMRLIMQEPMKSPQIESKHKKLTVSTF